MKKLLSLSMLCLGVLGGARAQTCGTTITSYPYIENFDGATSPGWTSGGTNSSWALGTPAKTIINSAASGTKSWVTSLTGQYSPSENSYVEGPCFNMSTLVQPVVEMKVWWNSEFSWDGAVLQSSIDGGTTWGNVGVKGDPNNWYNDNSINGAPGGQPAATAEGWTGRNSTSNGSGGWVTVKHVLTGLGGKPNVKLRIAFGSDAAIMDEGFAFDNFTVYETPANDASVTSITAPVSPVIPSTPTPVSVTLKNLGTSPLTTATLGFSVNNVVQPTFPWTGNLALNATSAAVQIGTFAFPAGVHKIKAWSKSPNGVPDGNPGNDTTSITIYSCNSLTGTYTIDKGSPASGTNFTSFNSAAQALASCGVSGPVIFNVTGSGSYNEVITLPNISGTSATNTITFNGNGNTITGSTAAMTDAVVKLDGAKFIRFNNLKIETVSTVTAGCDVILQNNANNNTFNGCSISHSVASTSTLYGIYISSGSNNTFQNNTINGAYYGVYAYGASATPLTNNQFIGNTLKDQYYYGFYLGYNTNMLLEGNDISRPTRTNGTTLYCFYLTTGNTGTIISKNRIHNTHDVAASTTGSVYGVYVSGAATVGNENIIKNNLMYNINNPGGYFYAFYNSGGNSTYYFHNTVSADNPAISYSTLRGMYFGSASTNVKFINNILSLSSPATTKHAIYLGSSTIALESNNNDLYIGTTGNIGYFSADVPTFAAWKTANSNAYDQASVSVDPIFLNPANYLQPLSAAVNNTGQPVPSVTVDINGATRSTTTPDAGAYEFTPATIDAGVTAIVAPTSPVTPGPNQPVQVTLKNFGTTTLTSAKIGWSLNGAAQTDYTWSGSLTNLQSSAPVQIGLANFPAGNFTIKAWSKLPNGAADPLAINDTTILKVVSCSPLAGAYTINKTIATGGTNFHSIAEATQRVNTCGVSGPVTFTVVSGTGPYNEQVEILSIPYTSATNTVTFEGSGNTVTSTPGAKPGLIILNGAKYVKVNNFVVNLDPAATAGYGVQLMNAADFNTISNNTINLPVTSTSSTINGIIAGSAAGTPGNNTNNTKIMNNIINGGYYSIQISGNTGGLNADNNQIVGNQIKDTYTYAIYVSNANGTLIEKNDISRPTRTNGGTLYNIYLNNGCLNTIVSKNRMHNANDMSTTKTGSLYGIMSYAAATPGNENIIKNNAIYNLNNPGGYVYALYNSGGNGTYYYNNTVASDPTLSYNTLRGMYFGSASTNVKFINNLISLPSTVTGTKHAIYLSSATIALVSDNNNLYVGTAGNIGYYSTDQVTLANWKAANTNAYDQNSVSADPVFVSPATGNLKPSSVAVDNLGQPLAAVTDDILGAARTATPDFGAFEFGVAANDVGIISVTGPSTTGCGLSATETITVTIKNYGANIQPSVPVNLWVDAVLLTPTGETYNVAPLAPNATATYVFTAKANLSVSGPHVIIANTSLVGDLITNNDADTMNVVNSLITFSGLKTIFDFETATTGLSRFKTVVNPKSNVIESPGASNTPLGTTSTKGMIMDGVDNTNWITPAGVTDPWTNNPNNFSAAYICVTPTAGVPIDSLFLTFDLKQLYKIANANTNFRVTVNGVQVGPTYRPPFLGTPINWQTIKVDLTSYKKDPTVMIGLESSVKEEYANGAGTANLIDNIKIERLIITGLKDEALQNKVAVFPNPSKGQFNVNLPTGKTYQLEVTDLTGKVILRQQANGNAKLNLDGTAKGIYLLKVSSEKGSAARKLIVE